VDIFKEKLTAGIRIDGNLLYNLPRISYINRSSTVVFNIHNKTNRLFCHEHNNNIYDIDILQWQHISVFPKTIFRPTYTRKRYNQCVHECTFYLCTLAWIWSKERRKHVAIVRYQYHVLLLWSWWNKPFILWDFVVFTKIVYNWLKI
jgi:hypothetical protein